MRGMRLLPETQFMPIDNTFLGPFVAQRPLDTTGAELCVALFADKFMVGGHSDISSPEAIAGAKRLGIGSGARLAQLRMGW